MWKHCPFHDFKIDYSYKEIAKFKKESFLKIVKKCAKKKAFDDLLKTKESHEKLDLIKYENLKIQKYLKSEIINVDKAKLIFKLRSHMYMVKANFPTMYTKNNLSLDCDLCFEEIDNQEHLLTCVKLKTEDDDQNISKVNYLDLYSNSVKKISKIAAIFEQKIKIRTQLMNESSK